MRYAPGRWDPDRWASFDRLFSVDAQCPATDAAANNCQCNLWNPDGTRSLWVVEFGWTRDAAPSAIDPLRLCRTTTRGTAAGTQTPDLDNDFEREITPDTGAVLDRSNFSVEPTIQTPDLYRFVFPTSNAVQSITWVFPGRGIKVPPGTGLGLFTTGAVATAGTAVYLTFRE